MSKEHNENKVIAAMLGPKLRAARLAHGLTQEQVARQLDCNAEYYGRLERGQGLPSVAMLDALADVLDVRVDDLLREVVESYPQVSLLDRLPAKTRKLAEDIAAKDYDFLRWTLRLMDYCARVEGQEGQAVDDDLGDDDA